MEKKCNVPAGIHDARTKSISGGPVPSTFCQTITDCSVFINIPEPRDQRISRMFSAAHSNLSSSCILLAGKINGKYDMSHFNNQSLHYCSIKT